MISKIQLYISINSWKLIIILADIWISTKAISDIQDFPKDSFMWRLIFIFLTITILMFNACIVGLVFTKLGSSIVRITSKPPISLKIIMVLLINFITVYILIFTQTGSLLGGQYIRLVIFSIVTLFTFLFLFAKTSKGLDIINLVCCVGITGSIFAFFYQFSNISNIPFSQSWSEGNRLYDYSLTFGQNLYNYDGDLKVPYSTPGRYVLWGILFLIPGLPIWAHRLWDASLWWITPYILSWILTNKIDNRKLRLSLLVWCALFIMQGPIYPHLLVPMILLSLFIRSNNFFIKFCAGVLISLYTGFSRYTWVILPGIWLVLHDLVVRYPDRKGPVLLKLLPPTILGLAGILPGVLVTWGGNINLKQATTSQPLLFYRLLPNSTYKEGILLGILWTALPLIISLAWLLISETWRIPKLTQTAIWVSLSGLLVIGLLASIKIGGGSNLHNLDMYILTIVFIVSLAITQKQIEFRYIKTPPQKFIYILLVFIILIPGWSVYRTQRTIPEFNQQRITNALKNIKSNISSRKDKGEILFLDQRQLLTFGYIKNVKLVPEYEKKYLMDQAMGNNQNYFNGFYKDLEDHRFAMIIADNQKKQLQGYDEAFSEENNAYIKWVSIPLLNNYMPLLTVKQLGLQLLVPRN